MERSTATVATALFMLGLSVFASAQTRADEGRGAGAVESAEPRDDKTLARHIQSLEERLAAMNVELNRLRRRVAARPELLGRIDRLEALARRLREDIDTLTVRQKDMERDRALVADGRQSPAAGSWQTGYQDGLLFRSAAGRFSVKVKGFIVGRYRLGAVQTSDATADPEEGVDANGLDLVYARLAISGHVWTPKLTYALSWESAGRLALKKAIIEVRPWSFWRITLGQHKVMDSRQSVLPTGRLQLFDRSRAVDAFAHGYDVGLSTTFSFWHQALVLQAGLFNGAGANLPNDDNQLLYVVRLGTAPFGPVGNREEDAGESPHPKLWLGVSGELSRVEMGDLDGDGKVDEKRIYKLGAEVSLQWMGFNFQSEFFAAIGHHMVADCPASFVATNRTCLKVDTNYGVYAQAGYVLGRGLQVAGRFSYLQVFDEGWVGDSNSGTWKRSLSPVLTGPEGYRLDHVYEATAGLLYDPWKRHLRLGLLYSFQRESFVSDSQSMSPPKLDRNVHLASLVARINF